MLTDTAQVSIEESFRQMKHHKKTWRGLYDLSKLPVDRKTLETLYGPSLDVDERVECSDINDRGFYVELNISHILPHRKHSPLQVLHFIHDAELTDAFPNVWIALRSLLTLPVTVTSGKCCFSKFRLIKHVFEQ